MQGNNMVRIDNTGENEVAAEAATEAKEVAAEAATEAKEVAAEAATEAKEEASQTPAERLHAAKIHNPRQRKEQTPEKAEEARKAAAAK